MQQQDSVVFTATNDVDATYDAYERDIAVVSFHFERPTAFAYVRLVVLLFKALIKITLCWLLLDLHKLQKTKKFHFLPYREARMTTISFISQVISQKMLCMCLLE